MKLHTSQTATAATAKSARQPAQTSRTESALHTQPNSRGDGVRGGGSAQGFPSSKEHPSPSPATADSTITVLKLRSIIDEYKPSQQGFLSFPGPELAAIRRLIRNRPDDGVITKATIHKAIQTVACRVGGAAYRAALLDNPDAKPDDRTGVSQVIRNIGRYFKELSAEPERTAIAPK